MPIKLTLAQYKIIAVAVAVAALSLGVSVKYFWRAFPEASIDLRVNRDDSMVLAQKFLTERGIRLDGYRHAARFGFDEETKLYLERTQGLERMNQLTRGPIRLWRWAQRWFKPQQKEEFRAEVTPSGEVVGFDHDTSEASPGANLDQARARDIAQKFLSEVMKRDLGDLEFLEAESNKRPARTDHSFIWKQKSVNLSDGSLRVEVAIAGDQVAAYHEFVKIPEQWTRDYEKLLSRNESAQIVDEVFWVLLSVAMLIILVLRLRDRDVPVRLSLGFGLVAAVLFFLGQLNTFSLAEFDYPTTDAYSSFITNYLIQSVISALGLGTLLFLLVASSEPVYRENFPSQPSLRRVLSWQGLRTRSFFMANVVGLALTFFFFAYQTVFYLAANKLGAWAPSDVPFSNELNTRIPWAAVLFTGFFPAVSEEMQFRAFAIPFLKKFLRSWPLALVLAAFNWGFLHSAYPNQPFFIRGVEVGVGGLVIGVIMLRFGIIATLIWHYSVDALYTAFLLLRSPNHYLMVSGAVTAGIMLIPLIIALVAYWRTGTFTEEAPLTNASQGVARARRGEAVTEAEIPVSYRPLSARQLALAGILAAVFIALAVVPVYRFGQGIKLRITRPEAVRVADAFLNKEHVAVASYRHVAWLHGNIDPLAVRYLLERRSVEASDRIYQQATRPLLWEVRYFRPLEKEEYRVYVDAAGGQVFGHRHLLDENAPGGSLPLEEARRLSAQSVQEHGYQPADFELQDSRGVKRKAREDYTFIWQAKPGDPRNVGDEHYRIQVDIAGDQVVSFSRFFKLPEDWVRQRTATRLPNVVLIGISSLFGVLLVGVALLVFVRQVRGGQISWRPSVKAGVFLLGMTALTELNEFSTLDRAYDTSIPLSTFHLFVLAGFVIAPLALGLLGWVLVALSTSLYSNAWQILRGSVRRIWRRDAAVALVTCVAAAAGLNQLEALLASRFHAYAPFGIGLVPSFLDTSWPGLGLLLHALADCVLYVAVAAVVIHVVRWGLDSRASWFWLGGLLLLVALGPARAHSVPEFALGWTMNFISLAVTLGIVYAFFRDNVLAYVGAAFGLRVAEPVVSLLSQPLAFFRWNGVMLAALAAVVLGWLLLPGRTAGGRQ